MTASGPNRTLNIRILKAIFLSMSLVLFAACSQAPTMVDTFVDSETSTANSRVVKTELTLREGSYCCGIKIGKKHGEMGFNSTEFDGKFSVKYIVEIPTTGVEKVTSLGLFDHKKYGLLFDGVSGYSFHEFSLDVNNIPKYRERVVVTAIFEGDAEALDAAKFGIHFSEWWCK